MTITCPSCQATYRSDPAALGEGRTVRCARCRSEWFERGRGAPLSPEVGAILGLEDSDAVDAIDDADQAGSALEAEVLSPRAAIGPKRGRQARGGAKIKPPRGPGTLRRAFARARPAALAAGLGLAIVGAMVAERVRIVRAAPSLASLYAVLGLPVNVRGLSIEGLRSVEEIDQGVPLLLVTGAVSNVSDAELDVPRLRLAVTGGADRELYAWTTVASRARLAPGESAPFRARLASPPAEGGGVVVRFLAQKDLSQRAGR